MDKNPISSLILKQAHKYGYLPRTYVSTKHLFWNESCAQHVTSDGIKILEDLCLRYPNLFTEKEEDPDMTKKIEDMTEEEWVEFFKKLPCAVVDFRNVEDFDKDDAND